MEKAIKMVDWEIDVAQWLENSLVFVAKWKGREAYFKQFNQTFIATYNALGKYGSVQTKTMKDTTTPLKRGTVGMILDRLEYLLIILDNETDHSDYNLMDKMNACGMDIKSIPNLRRQLTKLKNFGVIRHKSKGSSPRRVEVIKKSLTK